MMTAADIRALAASPDILTLGMHADEARRHTRLTTVTYVRVAASHVDAASEAIPEAAREIRVTGRAATLHAAVAKVRAIRNIAGDRFVSGFSLADLAAMEGAGPLDGALRHLRAAGLDMVAEAPIDRMSDAEAALHAMESAGFERGRLTVDRAPADGRLDLLLRAQALASRFRTIVALSPLPMVLNAFRPTTGYDDVKTVALARLALPSLTIQVDWQRYGPKLAQVALTFGADDLDNVPARDEAPEGPRRSTLADVIRNIEAAGFVPAERNGDFSRP